LTRSVAPRGISPGGADHAVDAFERIQLAGQAEAGGPGFIDDQRRGRKFGDRADDALLVAGQLPFPKLAREHIEDSAPHLRDMDIQRHPGPNLRHGRHLHNCGGAKATSSALTRGTYERVPTELLAWPSASTAIGSRGVRGLSLIPQPKLVVEWNALGTVFDRVERQWKAGRAAAKRDRGPDPDQAV
jgi:hypothetical protein